MTASKVPTAITLFHLSDVAGPPKHHATAPMQRTVKNNKIVRVLLDILRSYGLLKSPLCSCVSITLPA